MADYKLKLDIDEKELARKIQNAMKGANIDTAMFGGQGAGSKAKEVQQIKHITEKINRTIYQWEQKTLDAQVQMLHTKRETNKEMIRGRLEVERESKARQKMNRQMAGYNTLLRQATGKRGGNVGKNIGGLLGGRVGGAIGGGIDAVGPMMKLMSAQRNLKHLGDGTEKDPDFIGPKMPGRIGKMQAKAKNTKVGKAAGALGKAAAMPVKVAGFMAGMAGAAGLGKMIIDSSPMLQAMLKLLNVGIMLILRPIGDFIGFMLRPLLLKFVKEIAIPAYRNGSKIAKEWGTKMGKAILLLFTNPEEFLDKAIIQPIKAQWEKQMAGFDRWFRIIGILLNPFNYGPGTDEKRAKDIKDIEDEEESTNAKIDAKYTGFGFGDTDMGAKLQAFQDLSHADMFDLNTSNKDILDSQNNNGNIMNDIYPWLQTGSNAANLTNTKLDTIDASIKANGSVFDQWMAAKNKQDTASYNLSHFGYEDTSSKEEAIAKGQKIFAEGNAKKQDAIMDLARLQEEARKLQIQMDRDDKGITGDGPYGDYSNPYHGCSSLGAYDGGGARRPQEDKSMLKVTSQGFDRIQRIMAQYNNYRIGAPGSGNSGSQSSDGEGYDIEELCRAKTMVHEMLAQQLITAEEAQVQYAAIEEAAILSSSSQAVTFSHYRNIEKDSKMAALANDKTAKSYEAITKQIEVTQAWITAAVERLSRSKTSKGKYTEDAKAAQDYLSVINGGAAPVVEDHGWQVTLPGGKVLKFPSPPGLSKKAIDYYKGQGASVHGYASGGIINEPIFGLGQNTGKKYSFGEAGPERVTPGTGLAHASSGGATNVYITMNGVKDMNEFERMLKPVVLKLLRDSTSRVGVV